MSHRKYFGITAVILALFLSLSTYPAASWAGSEEAAQAARRVNIAGRQRMLSQRMTQAACFIHSGINTEEHVAMLREAVALFASSHDALRYGDESLGLGPENLKRVNEVLFMVDGEWNKFRPVLDKILAGQPTNAQALRQLDENGLALLEQMNKAVGKISTGYSEVLPDFPLDQSITIDIAGRQRMLSQKAKKELCLINAGVEPDKNRDRLAKTTKLFSDVLAALVDGIPGMVAAAPNDAIRDKLLEVKTEWEQPQGVFAEIAAGGTLCCGKDQIVIEEMETVLKTMNQAVGMYETAW